MYTFDEFQADVLRIAHEHGYLVEHLRGTEIPQVDFGHKKLHGRHFRALFPAVLADDTNINGLIKRVAPGRPCTHPPFREIVGQIRRERPRVYTEAVEDR